MKKAPVWTWFVLIGMPVLALVLSYHKYLFDSPHIDVVDLPEMKVIYSDYTGSYQKATDDFLPFLDTARANGLSCKVIWGQYFDYPYIVPDKKLRARVGCTVDTIPGKLPKGMHGMTIPARMYLRARREDNGVSLVYRLHLLMNLYAVRHQLFLSGYLIDYYDSQQDGPYKSTLLIPVVKQAE